MWNISVNSRTFSVFSAQLCYVRACYCYMPPIRPSVCPHVTQVSHAYTVQDIQVFFTTYDTASFLVSVAQFRSPEPRTSVLKRGTSLLKAKIWPIICNNLETMRDRMQVGIIGSRIWAFDWYQNRWPWMTLNGVMAVIVPHSVGFRADYVKVIKDTPYFLRRKCSPKNLVFSDVSSMAIFVEVTENECIIERHLCDVPCQKALIWPIRRKW